MTLTDIPQVAAAFKTWADRSCGAWPAEMQKQAWQAWREMVGGPDAAPGSIETFKTAFAEWEG